MIIRGTTPTIIYTFQTVDPAEITTAYLTVKKGGAIVLEKDLSGASVGEKTLAWTFTQADTLSVTGAAEIMLNWKLQDGTRGASLPTQATFAPNHKDEVI